MVPLITLLLGLSVLSGLPRDVVGGCSTTTVSPSPLVVTSFGSKNFINNKVSVYEREIGEELQLYCGGGFRFTRSSYNYDDESQTTSSTKMTLECRSDSAFHNIYEDSDWFNIRDIQCLNRVHQMFESETDMVNCANDMSLVLGYDFGDMGSIKEAAMCYDILGAKLKYFSYTTFPSKNRMIETQVGQLSELGLDINVTYNKNLIKSISQTDIDTFMLAEKRVASLFVNNAFQYASLAQDNQLPGYEDMLGTIWLRVLRSGNWAHWLSALRVASDAGAHFDVRMGVSGTLELPVPALGHCNGSRSLVIGLQDGSSLPVPAHIWAHVRALKSTGVAKDDEFVLIGHNSPFFRSDNSSALCPSMCDQVSWLRGSLFASLHEFPAYGLVQCCRVEDVAQKLDNFAGAFVEAAATSTPVPPTLVPKYEKTLGQMLIDPAIPRKG